MTRMRSTCLTAVVATLWLAVLILPARAQGSKTSDPIVLRGAGSTFASLLYRKWIETYRNAYPNVSITYDAIGSGEGVARFIAEIVDFAGSDALMSEAEIAKVRNGVTMVPTTAGMIVLAYNLPGVKPQIKLPRDVYADIFARAIKRWDDTRILDANPGVSFPHIDIVLVARQDISGSTLGFTQHLAAIKPTWRELGLGVGKLVQWPAGTMLASGNEGVVARIKTNEGAIGYLEYGFPERLGLPMAALQNRSGKFISPNANSEQLALAGGAPPLKELDASVVDPAGAGAYPVVSYSWIAINQKYSDMTKGTAMREFVDWGLSHGQELGVDLGYVPLPAGVIAMSKHALGAPGL